MRLLLDTQLLLWAASADPRLSKRTRTLIAASTTTLFYSVASLWEVAIKQNLGRPDFQVDCAALRDGLLDGGYCELPIEGAHVTEIVSLPQLHKDPFDRLLVAQAIAERLILLTADKTLLQYGGPVKAAI